MYMGRSRTSVAFIALLVACLIGASMLFGVYISWKNLDIPEGSTPNDTPEEGIGDHPTNILVTGNSKVEVQYVGEENNVYPLDRTTVLYGENKIWTSDSAEVAYIILNNNGDKTVNYSLGINIVSETGSVNVGGEEFKLSDYLEFGFISTGRDVYSNPSDAVADLTDSIVLSSGVSKNATLEAGASTDLIAVVVYLPRTCIDKVTVKEGEKLPEITFGLTVLVTQPMGGDNNDDETDTPVVDTPVEPEGFTASTTITDVVTNGVLSSTVTIGEGQSMGAFLPEGVKLEDGATEVTLNVANTNRSSNINMTAGELSKSLDVHIDGIALDNDVPVAINLGPVFPVGYNTANIRLYHVENGEAIEMELVDEFTAHNQFVYIPETGEVIIYIASFSEITAVFTANNRWDGTRDYTWYDPNDTELYIENAAQLAGFGAIVGGMAEGIEQDSFEGKTVYLSADIVIGDLTDEDGRDVVFYPIGYNSSDGLYEKTGVAVSTGFYSFMGTFDGQGYTISDWYQNTWEMKGDHNWYAASEQRYRDGMGLFGKVYGGTIKNLVIRNFSSDGEIATTGVIAAYADCGATFENIQIYNCNPRVYNIGNGGIVGCVGWYAKEADTKVYFKNITVDDSNKISALWGSWDVSCGGIVGQYYAISGQTSAGKPANGGIVMENCDVAAEIDVFNDVCGNYQYYQYRYAGMLIGTVGQNSDPSEDAKKLEFNNCYVRYGDWAEYYYCELVSNSQASYTHDYQMSRLTKIASLDEIKSGSTWLKAGNFVLKNTDGTMTCYHIVNDNGTLKQHLHTDSGYETDIDEDGDGNVDLKEDKQVVHITFKQLYTGYGWGATPFVEGVIATEYLYSIKYINNKKVLFTDYIKDNSNSYPTNSTKGAQEAATQAENDMKNLDPANKYEFDYWMNAGSTRIDSVDAGNRQNILLYPSFKGVYTAIFVDQQGNIIHWDTFTSGSKLYETPIAPAVKDCEFDYWEVHVTKNGKTTTTNFSEYAFNDGVDITIYPIYTYKGDVNLIPVDSDNDGIINYYQVGGYSDPNGQALVEIPETVNGKPILEIAGNAFSSYDGVHSILIPKDVTYIGDNAFAEKWGTFDSGETITIYYGGSYADWIAKEPNFGSNWESGISSNTKIFFLNGGDTVDTSQGYLQAKVSNSRNVTWTLTDITSSIIDEYTKYCDCEESTIGDDAHIYVDESGKIMTHNDAGTPVNGNGVEIRYDVIKESWFGLSKEYGLTDGNITTYKRYRPDKAYWEGVTTS